ncbi:MAG: ROK family protein, partial [Actinomycetes bacterium]
MTSSAASSSLPQAILAFDIGGTHVSAALVELPSWLVVSDSERRRDLDAHGSADAILDAIAACGHAVLTQALGRFDVSKVSGCAMPGPFDYDNGIGHFEGVNKFESLNGCDVRTGLLDRLAAHLDGITFLNDADSFLLGEWVSGAVVGADRVAGITLGTGIGSAFMADGKLVGSGPDVPPFGEVHLLSIKGVPLEDVVSRKAVRVLYTQVSGTSELIDVQRICDLARAGDPAADQAVREPYSQLGAALVEWLIRFGASALVVGGSISKSWYLVGAALS